MTSFLRSDRSRAVAIWLFSVAVLVLVMVMVGGATRLTGSGLSITEWRPVTGAIPPLSDAGWASEFAKYKATPQYRYVNEGMSFDHFKVIYWWEWIHRFLGRLLGLAFVGPFVFFLIRREIPKRLVPRCFGLLLLGGLQGLVGWWMVTSGLSDRVSVAPERLMVHLALALFLFGSLIWCAFEAVAGQGRIEDRGPWARGGLLLTGLIFLQSMLGALVAGNDAGKVYNDWPLMNGQVFPRDYAADGIWATIAHSHAAVQFNHRLLGYVIFVAVIVFAIKAVRSRLIQPEVRRAAVVLGIVTVVQVVLGVVTLMAAAPVSLGMLHQALATLLLGVAVALTWRARRI